MFKDKSLLITGGIGMFGNAMLKGFLNTNIWEITFLEGEKNRRICCPQIIPMKQKRKGFMVRAHITQMKG